VRIFIFICFAALLGVPFIFRPVQSAPPADALQLIIITPHNEQIRYEFARRFDDWHFKRFGQRVNVLYNVPGGTAEIRKMLESQAIAALDSGKPLGGNADLVFGGGSFEFGRLKKGVRFASAGQSRDEPITSPVDFTDEWLAKTYGGTRIGDDPLFDKDKFWFGAAISSFGIIFNRDSLRTLGVEDPLHWADLCNPRLLSNVALVNPNQSGSITTAFEAILKRSGWSRGWQILRRAGANARYFSASSLKAPIDVSQGQAAMGVCIDYYGRFQSQALKEAGDPERIGYIDPPDGSVFDVDPIAMLRNPPHPEVAKRFIEFVLSEDGQALWQFSRQAMVAGDPELRGPDRFELRRLPAVRSMYAKYIDHFVDRVNPFELARPIENNDPNYRDFIAPMFAAMVMDSHQQLKRAWRAIVEHPAFPRGADIVAADDVTDQTLREMLDLFDALPVIAGPGGATFSLGEPANLATIRAGWLKGDWKDLGLWNRESSAADEMRRQFGRFFHDRYQRILTLADQHSRRL
jgi:iron(III) transport system substrate-binding protein